MLLKTISNIDFSFFLKYKNKKKCYGCNTYLFGCGLISLICLLLKYKTFNRCYRVSQFCIILALNHKYICKKKKLIW